jgi:ATP adenylyltransferase
MNQLWAPWRMEYIGQSEPLPGCLFCAMVQPAGDDHDHVVYRGKRAFVVLNRYPYNAGHLMVVPHQHVGALNKLEPEMAAEMLTTAQLAVRVLEEAMRPEGFNLGINQGKAAGAGIEDHIHLHVVPRWNGDTNFMPVLAGAKVIPEHLSATAAKLRPIFSRLEHPT